MELTDEQKLSFRRALINSYGDNVPTIFLIMGLLDRLQDLAAVGNERARRIEPLLSAAAGIAFVSRAMTTIPVRDDMETLELLFSWADQHAAFDELLQAALTDKPGNKRLQELATELGLILPVQQSLQVANPLAVLASTIRNSIGISLFQMKMYEKAVNQFGYAIELWPQSPNAICSRGWSYFNLQQYDKALEDYNHAVEVSKNERVYRSVLRQTLVNRGILLRKFDRTLKASWDFEQALSIRPNDPKVITQLGLTSAQMSFHKDAVGYYSTALALKPKYFSALMHRANSYIELGLYEEALQDLRAALKIKPRMGGIYYNFACVAALRHQEEEALSQPARAVSLDASLGVDARVDKDLESLQHNLRFQAIVGVE